MKLFSHSVFASLVLASMVASLPVERRQGKQTRPQARPGRSGNRLRSGPKKAPVMTTLNSTRIDMNNGNSNSNSNSTASTEVVGAAFFITNEEDGNFIVSANIGSDGQLTLRQALPAGGNGIHGDDGGVNNPDPLFSSGSIRVNAAQNLLATVNSASNTIALFSINPDDPGVLQPVGLPIGSGGEFPVSVAFNSKGDTLCALNGGEINNVRCFSVDKQTGLAPLAGTARSLNLQQTTPATGAPGSVSHIIFSEDDKQLIISAKGDNPDNNQGNGQENNGNNNGQENGNNNGQQNNGNNGQQNGQQNGNNNQQNNGNGQQNGNNNQQNNGNNGQQNGGNNQQNRQQNNANNKNRRQAENGGQAGNGQAKVGFVNVFDVAADGSLSAQPKSLALPQDGVAPFGMALIPKKNAVLVTDPAIGFSVFDLAGQKDAKAFAIDNQIANGWATFSPKVGNFFLSDVGKGVVTEVSVDDNLAAKVVSQVDIGAGTGTEDSDVATIGDKDFLYVLAGNATAVEVLSLDGPGQAKRLQTLDIAGPAATAGLTVNGINLQGMAVFVKNAKANQNNANQPIVFGN
ncbi:hypothetical protein VNI00_005093 [Paramarasmius palmivorus]|uniref:Uncharacterized protein n=1 Tax=Paramarasmius palmivorus TaxID=297713 RepID=A0AAW0DEL1_9AGAR